MMLTDVISPLMQDCVVCLDVSVVPAPLKHRLAGWTHVSESKQKKKQKIKAEQKFVQQTPIRFNL